MWFKTDIKRRLPPVRRGDNTDVFLFGGIMNSEDYLEKEKVGKLIFKF